MAEKYVKDGLRTTEKGALKAIGPVGVVTKQTEGEHRIRGKRLILASK